MNVVNQNPNPAIRRIVVKAYLQFASPALIGSGEKDYSDNDILRDGTGNPFLPGSAMAGSLRALLTTTADGSEAAKKLFGDLKNDRMSPLWVLDSDLFKKSEGSPANVILIDGVAIETENKVAVESAKYDFEAIDAGTRFVLRMMLVLRKDDEETLETYFDSLLTALSRGTVYIGGKTRRGFGRISCQKIERMDFDFKKDPKQISDWAGFDWAGALKEYTPVTPFASEAISSVSVDLKIDGSIMIRDFKDLGKDEQYAHMNVGGQPVILGTSWAGAVKNGLKRLLSDFPGAEAYLDSVLGAKIGDKTIVSLVEFDASVLEKVNEKEDGYRKIVRVKIDRFTGGAANGALFTSRPWFGGKTVLTARFPAERKDIAQLIGLAVDAIDKGLITIGGETSIGRGVLKTLDPQESILKDRADLLSAIGGAK